MQLPLGFSRSTMHYSTKSPHGYVPLVGPSLAGSDVSCDSSSSDFRGLPWITLVQSLGSKLTGKGYDSFLVKSAQDFYICLVPAYNLCDGGRPSIMIGRSVGVIFTILADDQRKVRVT